uniref:Uncharacterized protein n=1 Tax=Leersia perrieri TaxID=77586 RepID=A0A0D9XRM5_9ORYZ
MTTPAAESLPPRCKIEAATLVGVPSYNVGDLHLFDASSSSHGGRELVPPTHHCRSYRCHR